MENSSTGVQEFPNDPLDQKLGRKFELIKYVQKNNFIVNSNIRI